MADASASLTENILISLLAVNDWPIEKGYALRNRLLTAGLLDLASAGKLSVITLFPPISPATLRHNNVG